ncbi:MAG: hypothetical protein ACTSRW_10285 [Candidatus Helarchaeota archaeon]
MTKLENDILEEMIRIVGERNVSNDPVITQAYAYNWCNELVNIRRGKEPSIIGDG